MFTTENLVDLCTKALRKVEDYDEVIGQAEEDGVHIGLAWRMGIRLDWIWQKTDLDGRVKEWAVLYGFALKQVSLFRTFGLVEFVF